MSPHPAIIGALARARVEDLQHAAARGGRVVDRHRRAHALAARTFGLSLRLRDGRWVHLRHDSA